MNKHYLVAFVYSTKTTSRVNSHFESAKKIRVKVNLHKSEPRKCEGLLYSN